MLHHVVPLTCHCSPRGWAECLGSALLWELFGILLASQNAKTSETLEGDNEKQGRAIENDREKEAKIRSLSVQVKATSCTLAGRDCRDM